MKPAASRSMRRLGADDWSQRAAEKNGEKDSGKADHCSPKGHYGLTLTITRR